MTKAGPAPVVLLAHGSPDPRHAAGIEALTTLVRERYAGPVHTAYLDHHPPAVGDLAAVLDPSAPVVLVPALLGQGYHWRVDVPNAAATLGSHVTVTAVLNDAAALAAGAVTIATEHDWSGPVVLIDDQGRQTLVRPGPPGGPTAAVPRTLCAGVLADRALDLAAAAGLTPLTGELARTSAVAGLVIERIMAGMLREGRPGSVSECRRADGGSSSRISSRTEPGG